jgi:hypothetical protein
MNTYGVVEGQIHHCLPRHSMEVSCQLHVLTAVTHTYWGWVDPRVD